MARSHFSRPIVDTDGTLITNAAVRVLQPGTTVAITDAMYTSRAGVTVRTQPWTPSDGMIDFYVNTPQTIRLGITPSGGSESYVEDLDVGTVYGDDNVLTYGARGDGTVADNYAALTAAISSMQAGDVRYFPTGTYKVGTTLQSPTVDGACLRGPGPAPQNRLGGAVITAKTGANLQAIMATQEWLTNGGIPDMAQSVTLHGLSFDGGGFRANGSHNAAIETTANTLHGLVVHGSGFVVDRCFILSANGHGLYIPGVGVNGTSPIGESHEGSIHGCGIRYTGGDGFHAGTGQQDSWMQFCKIQYSGGHNIFTDNATAGWSFIHNHPSWAAKDSIHCESGWNYRIALNYIGSVGEYMDNTGYPSTHYGIYIEGGHAVVVDNTMNTNTSGGQVDPVSAISVHHGPVTVRDNRMLYQVSDNFVTMVEENSLTKPPSVVADNYATTA